MRRKQLRLRKKFRLKWKQIQLRLPWLWSKDKRRSSQPTAARSTATAPSLQPWMLSVSVVVSFCPGTYHNTAPNLKNNNNEKLFNHVFIIFLEPCRGYWKCGDCSGGQRCVSDDSIKSECCGCHRLLSGKVGTTCRYTSLPSVFVFAVITVFSEPNLSCLSLSCPPWPCFRLCLLRPSPTFSLPSEVCTVISDASCITPVQTICNAASPSPDCQMILRQFFNDTGVFCLNVSLANNISLAMASARVSVAVGGWEGKEEMFTEISHKWVFFLIEAIWFHSFQPLVVHQLGLLRPCWVVWFWPALFVVWVWCTGEWRSSESH